ncbi:Subtilase family protein [Nakamurella panacisegetis]|uniref:Subtilase family protein n=1 Tax=Nakamurella panacisegetis TaxID=1090615 RepID=A0A1H0RS62_9ACTN|nr:S8 family serine peptidase [Nakamurella panacisegetis]SDP32283.1 Subtilase family protein [Nakamurella panacisegetis]
MTDPAATPGSSAPNDPFARYEARVLDPATAVRLPGGAAPTVTVYRGDTLLVNGADRATVTARIDAVAALATDLGLRRSGPDPFVEIDRDGSSVDVSAHNRFARLLGLAEQTGTPLVVPVRFESSADGPAPAIDVWPLLQAVRAAGDAELVGFVGLDHLMFAAASISGNPYTRGMSLIGGDPYTRGMAAIGGNPYTRGMSSGVDQYLQGGSGGHGPVSVVLAPPQPAPGSCRPQVVVMDTGAGEHPWFDAYPVQRRLTLDNGDPIGLDVDDPVVGATDPEGAGAVADPLTGLLNTHTGHGTFIAGLLRQSCPDAEITAVRIMGGDGVVAEDELTQALTALGVRLAQHPGSVDALVLSLGYYVETTDDLTFTAGLKDLLVTLAARGVVTFAAAGNDCTDRRSYPAAFSDHPEFTHDGALPLLSVAALNPDRSVALFSNDGCWVNGEAPGANVVSTAPVHLAGAWAADTGLIGPNGERRGTIDPDQFSSGFATWSGTSFAAPVLAGEFLAGLVRHGCPKDVADRRKLVPARSVERSEQ